MKLGYNTWSMPNLAFDEAVPNLARLGFDSVEVTVSEGWRTDVMLLAPGDATRWKRIAAENGIVMTSLTANVPVLVDGERWRGARERLTRSLTLAAELGEPAQRMPVSLTASEPPDRPHSAPVSSENAWRDNRALVIDRFSELASIAAPLAVQVALEPHFATVVCNAPRALDVLQAVSDKALGLNLDVSHFAVQGLPIAGAVRALGPHAIACEVKDHRGIAPDFEFLVPGEGDFDYPTFLNELAQSGYDGSVAVEISVFRQRAPGYDPYDAAARSYAVLAKAFEDAGLARAKRAPGTSTRNTHN
jgi:sugar phosphate isomerase/epimerase